MTTPPPDAARLKRLEMWSAIAGERLTRLNLLWVQLEQGGAVEGGMADLLREVHTLKGEAALMGFSQLVAVAHAIEELLRPQAQGAAADAVTGDVLLRGLDILSAAVQSVADADGGEVAAFQQDVHRLRGVATVAGSAAAAPAAPAAPQPALRERAPTMNPADSVRVTSAKLDLMRDLIGELMLAQSRLELCADEFRRARETTREYCEQQTDGISAPAARLFAMLLESTTGLQVRLREDSYRIGTLTAELDAATRALRMVPIRSLLEQYPVAVRELARELGREVRLEFHGDTIEVDRSVLERLADPLLHLLRNAVDHGIEPAEVRRRRGKRPEGTVVIRARLQGSMLELTVSDDGAGIDVELVRARAVELGFYDAAQAKALTSEQVLRTLFYARMSTQREVTLVSGRGIGLDVVLTQVEGLGGSVAVHSTLGSSTSFQLSVPVTLATTALLLFDVGSARYALPAASVVALVDASGYPVIASIDGDAIRYDGALVPLVRLDELVGEIVPPSEHAEGAASARLIIVQRGRQMVALSGSSRHTGREVVLKAKSRFFAKKSLINAAVPLEDGTLALIFSVNELFAGPRAVHSPTPKAPPPSRRVKTVLVVDDSPVVRDLLAEALRAHGLRVIEASDGEDALRKLESEPDTALVVTDVDMPKLDGIGLLQKLRKSERPRRMPVVIVSMRGSSEDQKRALAAGADAYLVKTDLSHAGLWTMLARFVS